MLGSQIGGLVGLSLGWVVAVFIEAAFGAPLVYRHAASQSHRHRLNAVASQSTSTN